MLKVKLFSNYYIFLEKISLLVNYVSFATKIFNIFKSLIENVSVRGEGRRGKCISAQGSSVPPLALRLREGAHYFQARAHLLWGAW